MNKSFLRRSDGSSAGQGNIEEICRAAKPFRVEPLTAPLRGRAVRSGEAAPSSVASRRACARASAREADAGSQKVVFVKRLKPNGADQDRGPRSVRPADDRRRAVAGAVGDESGSSPIGIKPIGLGQPRRSSVCTCFPVRARQGVGRAARGIRWIRRKGGCRPSKREDHPGYRIPGDPQDPCAASSFSECRHPPFGRMPQAAR